MKFSQSWLKAWMPNSAAVSALPTKNLCEQLTNAGLEVDGTQPIAAEFTDVVVASVKEVAPHPNADKLSLCTVDAGGAGDALTIVCGAPNVRPGLKAPLALPGAQLPGGKIKRTELRGVASDGMLCSAQELGLGDDHDGLLEIDDDALIGADLREALDLDDVTVELDLTPNRGDCLSIRGVAREVALLNDATLEPPGIEPVAAVIDSTFPVTVDAPQGCPRYLGRVIEGVDLSRRAPWWMRERLRRCGLRSIDPVVDITNYVLLELGQPMHAFDQDQLKGGINVRMAQAGETLKLLDGNSVELNTDTLLITDADGPVAMAGIMGGERSGVSAQTQNVFLECAFFARDAVMGIARRHGLHTDAAHRYERGVDFELQMQAMERATKLLLEIVGGKPGPVVETISVEHLPTANTVTLRKRRLDLLVGETIPEAQIDRIFAALEFHPKKQGTGDDIEWTVTAPSHRFDIEREEDLVEEVLRIYGYNAIASRMPTAAPPLGSPRRDMEPSARIADALADLGYSEAITYSFIDPKSAHLLDPERQAIPVVNPVSQEHSMMRTTLLPGLVSALTNNLSRQMTRVRLFEMGQCFVMTEDGLCQEDLVGGIAMGARFEEAWSSDGEPMDFFDIKGDVERLLQIGGRAQESGCTFDPANDPVLHPGQSASVAMAGETVGRLGRLHPELEQSLDLPEGVYVFEFKRDALLASRERRHGVVSRHPSVRRDLAVVVNRSVTAAGIERVVEGSAGELLSSYLPFDVYVGKGIGADEKSVAIALTLQHPSRTLTDAEVSQCVDGVMVALERQLGARLR